MKKSVLLILSIIFGKILVAQISSYSISSSNEIYTPITGGTILFSGNFDDGLSSTIAIPSFTYNCATYTTLRINTNGHIAFGTYTSSINYTPLSSNVNASGGIISAFGRDLASAATGTPEVRYELVVS